MNEGIDELLLRALRDELRIINKHLVYERKRLCDLLKMDTPYFILRDGSISIIDRRELELLRNLTSDPCKLKLPIIIEYDPSLGEATYIIRDDEAVKAIAKLLDLKNYKIPLFIYRPQLYIIRSRLRTTTTIVFIPR
jgi:uncharacterized protein (UPF0216 family)